MSVFVNPLKSNKAKLKEEIERQIHNHKQVAIHLEDAAKHHRNIATYYEDGNYELAKSNTIEANRQLELAIEKAKKISGK